MDSENFLRPPHGSDGQNSLVYYDIKNVFGACEAASCHNSRRGASRVEALERRTAHRVRRGRKGRARGSTRIRHMEYLEPGTGVEVHGLKARPDLNGRSATVVAYVAERERYQVRVDEGSEEVYLRPSNVSRRPSPASEASAERPAAEPTPAPAAHVAPAGPTASHVKEATAQPPAAAPAPHPPTEAPTQTSALEYLEPGSGVEVNGLKARPDLNTKLGRVVIYVPDRERYHVVILGTNEEIYLRPANLTRSLVAAAAIVEEEAAAKSSAFTAPNGVPAATAPPRSEGGAGPSVEEGTAEKEAILREATAAAATAAAAAAAAAEPTPPLEEIKDSETLLKEFFADISDATRDAEVDRILACFKLNPYEHLNLRFDASEEDIRRAFRKVSLMVHPDKCKHPNAKTAFDAIGQAQQLLGQEDVKKELDFNLGRAREEVLKAWRKDTRNDVVLRVRFQGDRQAQMAAFVETDEFHERWKLEGRKYIVDLEWRRRKLTLRIKSEEERVSKEESEEKEERKARQKRQKAWDNEKAREQRVGGWRDFMGGQKVKRKKVAGEFRAPALKKEERAKEEEYHGLDKNGNRVLRPDEVSRAW